MPVSLSCMWAGFHSLVSQHVLTSQLPEHEVIFLSGGAVVGYLWPSAWTAPTCPLLCLYNWCFCILVSHRASFRHSLFQDPGRSDWIKASAVGKMAAEEFPPASSSTSSERRQHPHIVPRDDVKSVKQQNPALRLCVQIYQSVVFVLYLCVRRRRKVVLKLFSGQ